MDKEVLKSIARIATHIRKNEGHPRPISKQEAWAVFKAGKLFLDTADELRQSTPVEEAKDANQNTPA